MGQRFARQASTAWVVAVVLSVSCVLVVGGIVVHAWQLKDCQLSLSIWKGHDGCETYPSLVPCA